MKAEQKTCQLIVAVAGLLTTLLLGRGIQAEDAPRDPKQNAALQYWQTFALLPDAGANAGDICREKVGEQLTKATRDHVAHANLTLLRRGAEMPYCEWGLNEADGPGLMLPHLAKARHLARIVAFRFQMLAEDGRANEGVQDLAACLVLSRHVASDAILISFLVHCAIDSMVIERSAFFLPQLDKADLKLLAETLDRLPPAQSAAKAILMEKQIFGTWMKDHLTAALKKGDAGKLLKEMGIEGNALAGLTQKDLLAQVEELDRFYDLMSELHALPLDEFRKKAPEYEARVAKAGPLTRMCLPALVRVRPKEVEMQVRFRMFRAAIDVLLEGPDALKRHPDPYDGLSFGYEKTEHGFKLTSKLKTTKGQVLLCVGGKLEARAPKGDAPPKPPQF